MTSEQELRALQLTNAELSAERARLQRKIKETDAHARRVEQAYRDALQLSLWAAAGVPPSRRYAATHGMTQRRWENATALLRQARIIQGKRRWVTKDAASIESRLERTRQAATEAKESYRARHVRHRRK